jgi:hypothetical protein
MNSFAGNMSRKELLVKIMIMMLAHQSINRKASRAA